MIDPINFVVFSSILLMIGAYGVIRNKNSIVVLMSVEIMLTAANVNFIAFSSFYKLRIRYWQKKLTKTVILLPFFVILVQILYS